LRVLVIKTLILGMANQCTQVVRINSVKNIEKILPVREIRRGKLFWEEL
jgi:hypothetical protein